jgi:gas vesicle protein
MDLGKVMTGLVIGGTIGAAGAMYAFTSDRERKLMMRQGKRMVNKTVNRINDMM